MTSIRRVIMMFATCGAFMVFAGTTFALPLWSESISGGSIKQSNIFNLATGQVNGITRTNQLFTPGVDLITSADVKISAFGLGDYTVNIEGVNHPDNFVLLFGTDTFKIPLSGVANLNSDGIISVAFSDVDLLVKLYNVTAEAWGTDNPAPVPEPGTFMLLGAGLLGLAVYRKQRITA